ncbi:uncharacterized protein FOMMEDRAFT_168883 [Fomitiporia mediterranea MF3/22]|uniref:uncharacterized protein n=1 Tax=Fomitiporia mediterranea (strain MF3/22) TaxID=694068 RepID=UPI0004409143|nr:uncharacterized protein FOMMEDRAFT_168883 [Fomitiporia mediterranea MF3/22]EJD02422.1 hypothetical protein FOMMEDRAFT_168883 [Fomitiporia mediterranea MF3/22]
MPPLSPPLQRPARGTGVSSSSRTNYEGPHLMHLIFEQRGKTIGRGKARRSSKDAHILKHTHGKSKETTGDARLLEAAHEVQATALPDPIPADSSPKDTTIRTTLTIPPTFSFTTTGSLTSTSQTSDSAEYPPRIRSTTTVWIPATKSSTSHAVIPTASKSPNTSSSTSVSHFPTYAIALIAVGAVGIALAFVLVLRGLLLRNGRVDRPRPSAPILQESPLFGGKERFSRGIWSDPSFNNLLSSHAKMEKGDGWRPLSGGNEYVPEKTPNKRQTVYLTANPVGNNQIPLPLSPASVYTTAAPPTAVGVALEFPLPPQTVNSGTQPLKVKNKGTEEKAARRRSRTASMYGGTYVSSPTLTDTETAFAYQAPRPAPKPGKAKSAAKSSSSSGDHAQRPPRKNAPSRASQSSLYRVPSASRAGRGQGNEEPFLYAIPTVKSEERRDRDTKALTSALGLASPPQPSSCFSPVSLYPDDSLSVAHGRASTRPPSEFPPSELPSPSATHAALGDFMLQDFPSQATFNSLHSGDPFANDTAVKKGTKGRVNDRPPRVPSPPPLPSLQQMALANADPDYRSPTYSIYGLYEAQRKSKTNMGSG